MYYIITIFSTYIFFLWWITNRSYYSSIYVYLFYFLNGRCFKILRPIPFVMSTEFYFSLYFFCSLSIIAAREGDGESKSAVILFHCFMLLLIFLLFLVISLSVCYSAGCDIYYPTPLCPSISLIFYIISPSFSFSLIVFNFIFSFSAFQVFGGGWSGNLESPNSSLSTYFVS